MNSPALLVFLSILSQPAFSITYSQTDWSGTPGVYGPVFQWSDDFFCSQNIDFDSQPGIVSFDPICYVGNEISQSIIIPKDIDSADLDNDGDMDLVTISWDGMAQWWENDLGSSSDWENHIIGYGLNGGNKICCADIDGDGDTDVAGAGCLGDKIYWWENIDGSGESWTCRVVVTDFNGALDLLVIDIDIDGDMDIIGVAKNDHTTVFFENWDSAGTVWIPHEVIGVPEPTSVCAADMDSDGDVDLFVGHSDYNDISLCENTPEGWIPSYLFAFTDNPYDLCSADMDLDGDPDILCAAYKGDEIVWLENRWDEQESWLKHTVDNDFNGAYTVHAFDLEDDGDIDILGSAMHADKVCIWENVYGCGIQWIRHNVVSDYESPSSAIPSDLTGDMTLEVIAVSQNDDQMHWFEPGEFQTQGYLESTVLYLGNDPDWEIFDCTASISSGTSIGFQVRASDDFNQMGSWSDTLEAPFDMDSILEPNLSYFQYRAIFSIELTTLIMPVLEEITAAWGIVNISSESAHLIDHNAFPVLMENPVRNSSLRFHTTAEQPLRISIYDTSGRQVMLFPEQIYCPGEHSLVVGQLPAGLYHLTAVSSECTNTLKFVIIE